MKKIISFAIALSAVIPSLVLAQTANTNASVQAQLQALLQQVSQLQSQMNGSAQTNATPSIPVSSPNALFTRNLTIGSQGTDVFQLQQLLITDGYLTAITVPTGYFGPATKNALIAYQTAKGISPATGFFGSLTRASINNAAQYQFNQSQNSSAVNANQPAAVATVQPTASLQANGSIGPIMVPYGSSVTLTWSSSNADSCQISPAEFTGTSGVQTVSNLTGTQTYSLTCTKGALSAVSSVIVNVAGQTTNYTAPSSVSNPSPTANGTVSQQNAVKAAQQYLNYTAFSHDGLVAQLEYGQFSQADATYGADNSGADWNAEAVKAAQQYMAYSAFSRGSLIAQLEYAKFTEAQAEYGANAVGL